jgi:hypothetical protein
MGQGSSARNPGTRNHRARLATALAVLAAVAASLAGCATASPPVDTTAASFGNNATGTVVFWARSDTITAATPLVKDSTPPTLISRW